MQKVKWTIVLLLMVFILFILFIPSVEVMADEILTDFISDEKNDVDLSMVSSDKCLEILLKNGLVIPEEYADYPELASFVKNITDKILENPQRTQWFNYSKAQQFALLIRTVVLDYEGIDISDIRSSGVSLMTLASGRLLYSTCVGDWYDGYTGYNCYAYAVGKTYWIDTGVAIGYEYEADDLLTMTVERLASIVTYDLQSWGYRNISYSYDEPDKGYWDRVIAVRKCSSDYHFMYMYSSSGIWRHKPGGTWILQYNDSDIEEENWTNEAVVKGKKPYNYNEYIEIYLEPTSEYNSDVVYIKYSVY